MSKVVLVSGGTKGIGKATCLALLHDGFRVVTFSRSRESGEALRSELRDIPETEYAIFSGDVSQEEDVRRIVHDTVERFGRIDVLINNAGTGYFSTADTMDAGVFRDMIETNLVGLTLLTREVIPHMKRTRSGLILNVVSTSGKRAFACGEFYSATKFGVMGYSEAIRLELKEFGIKVSTLCPGMIQTDFFAPEELERRIHLNGGIRPQMLAVDDVTRVIRLVCSQSVHCDIQDIALMPF